MAEVTVTKTVKAPLSRVWESWNAFADIYRFNPGVKHSALLEGSAATGLGARRQCDLADGKNLIREQIIGYVWEQKLVIDIYEGTLPLKSALVTFAFSEEGNDLTDVSMTMAFKPKFGLMGALMVPMMKLKLRAMMQGLLDGNADYVERGAPVAQAA